MNKTKGYVLTVVGVGGGVIGFFLMWNSWLSTNTIQNGRDISSVMTSINDLKDTAKEIRGTVNSIALHDNVQISFASTTPR